MTPFTAAAPALDHEGQTRAGGEDHRLQAGIELGPLGKKNVLECRSQVLGIDLIISNQNLEDAIYNVN